MFFPLFLGFLLDLLTLDLLRSSVAARTAYALAHPVSTILLHWFSGLLVMFHVAFFASLLRRIVRRSVLSRFLRYPNEAEEHPFREFINVGLLTQMRRLGWSTFMYSMVLLVGVHVPSLIMGKAVPGLAPVQFRSRFPLPFSW